MNEQWKSQCMLCPNQCGINRSTRQGLCSAGCLANVSSYQLHFWEEPIISGTKGSGTVFFSGCSLSCVFCQNAEISRSLVGKDYSAKELSNIFKELEAMGAHNINLVSPTPYSYLIMEALEIYRPKIPVVYNTGGYEKADIIRELQGYIDIYLPDFKYGSNDLGHKYSSAKNYFDNASASILEMIRQQPKCIINSGGIMQKGVLVRHLVLPNNLENTKKVLDFYAENLIDNAYLSLMSQYLPMGNLSCFPEIARKLKPIEYKIAISYAEKLKIENCFTQDMTSANTCFIPKLK